MIKQFAKFILVGILNTLVGFSLYAIFLAVGTNFKVALLLSTCFGIIFNFFSTGRLVFVETNSSLILNFVLVYAFSYWLNIACINLFLQFGINKYGAFLISAPILSLTSFFLMKLFVFTRRSN